MLETLKLVQGAVSTVTLIPVLTHFAFHDGRVRAFSGRLSIDAPLPELKHLTGTVPAEPFVKAVEACGDAEFTVMQYPNGVTLESEHLTVSMPCGPLDAFPGVDAQPQRDARATMKPNMKCPELLPALRALRPFIGSDASRAWAMGILFEGGTLAATNNTTIATVTLPRQMKRAFILPAVAVDELLRLNLSPRGIAVDSQRATFFLPGDITLQTALVDGAWPKSPGIVVEEQHTGAKFKKLPPRLHGAVKGLLPFCADPKAPVVFFDGDQIHTAPGPLQGHAEGFKGLGTGKFRVEPLLAVLEVAQEADFGRFPRVPWKGLADDGIAVRGIVLGML